MPVRGAIRVAQRYHGEAVAHRGTAIAMNMEIGEPPKKLPLMVRKPRTRSLKDDDENNGNR